MAQHTISGVVHRITYRNSENGYTVFRLEPADNPQQSITVTGIFASLHAGESIQITGEWIEHSQYGRQFKADAYHQTFPVTEAGLIKYLGSGLIKGIGPVTAKRIVNHCGLDALHVIENEADRLQEIDGIGAGTVEKIINGWQEQKAIRDVMLFLAEHNVSSLYAAKLYKMYGAHTIRTVQENPYQLIYDIYGISFKKADNIAANLGFQQESLQRIEAAVHFLLHKAAEDGHLYLPMEELIERGRELLDVTEELIQHGIHALTARGYAFLNEEKVFLTAHYHAEETINQRIQSLMKHPLSLFDSTILLERVRTVEKRRQIQFGDQQRSAILQGINQQIFILTGGPGTGKTTTVIGFLDLFRLLQKRIVLCAPTGRAAKRLEESTEYEAKTIHRLLEYNPRTGQWNRDRQSPLQVDVVIVDECSMLDASLTAAFLEGVSDSTQIIFVGDVDQLPSVGPGNVLRDLIESKRIQTAQLDVIYRQDAQSQIVLNAHRINRGEFPLIDNVPGNNFFFKTEHETEHIPDAIVDLCKRRLPQEYNIDPLDDIQILTPMYKGECGANNLNRVLQETLNPSGSEIQKGERLFRIGDKIMQIRNNYDKDIFNGDIGRITGIDIAEQIVQLQFQNRILIYDFTELDEITHAYAISVHRSQGSEYPCVILPIVTQQFIMLQRNLLYTAITRARELCILIGTKKALAIAVKNARIQDRYTTLKQRLENVSKAAHT